MRIARFNTEDAARALRDILLTGHIRTDRHGWHTDELWDLGLLWCVEWHEADARQRRATHTGYTSHDYGWKVTDRGRRYIAYWGLGEI
tara:strand:+ start:372 stop:635 length:264 start_codon:yes stop_codon:yes gene_type:complete